MIVDGGCVSVWSSRSRIPDRGRWFPSTDAHGILSSWFPGLGARRSPASGVYTSARLVDVCICPSRAGDGNPGSSGLSGGGRSAVWRGCVSWVLGPGVVSSGVVDSACVLGLEDKCYCEYSVMRFRVKRESENSGWQILRAWLKRYPGGGGTFLLGGTSRGENWENREIPYFIKINISMGDYLPILLS